MSARRLLLCVCCLATCGSTSARQPLGSNHFGSTSAHLTSTRHHPRLPLLAARAADAAPLGFDVADYSSQASGLFNNMRAPASFVAGVLLGASFSLLPAATDTPAVGLVKRLHMLIGLASVSSELVAITACTVSINKLSELKLPPTAGVYSLLMCDPDVELSWLAANVNFFAGLFGLMLMTGVRGYLALSVSCGPLWGGAAACIAAAAGLQMASMINRGIASGGGSMLCGPLQARPRFGRSLLGLVWRYVSVLCSRARGAPLAAMSLMCAVGAAALGLAGVVMCVQATTRMMCKD
jgi:xanthosine utilization system XapX-like protein